MKEKEKREEIKGKETNMNNQINQFQAALNKSRKRAVTGWWKELCRAYDKAEQLLSNEAALKELEEKESVFVTWVEEEFGGLAELHIGNWLAKEGEKTVEEFKDVLFMARTVAEDALDQIEQDRMGW